MLGGFFKKFTEQADDFYHSRQIEEFFAWLRSQPVIQDKESVFLNLPLQNEIIDSRTRKKVSCKNNSFPAFILCEPRQLAASLKILNDSSLENDWYLIFYASGIEIWENTLRHGKISPLRFGIGEKEKTKILSFARKSMENFFKEEAIPKDQSSVGEFPAEGERVSLDVALWIKGDLRGSIIVENKPLYEGIKQASLGALRDKRMKPVEARELAEALIEVTIFSNLRLPLRKEDVSDSNIDGRRGYYVSHEEKRGWYLPAVFNCVKFKGMANVRESLIREKAKISSKAAERVALYTFMVDGFVESSGDRVLSLDGPVALEKTQTGNFNPTFLEEVRTKGDRAAEWLLSMQDTDGFMPLYADPMHSSFGRMDWGRLACTVHALACYGQVTGQEQLQKAAQKGLFYLSRHVLGATTLSANDHLATLIYLARAAMAMKENNLLEDIMESISIHRVNVNSQPILVANLATLFLLRCGNSYPFLEDGISLAEQVLAHFKSKLEAKKRIQLAEYPELAHVLELISQVTGEKIYMDKALQVKEWLVAQQFENGSFPSHSGSYFVYSRGTGKIFEVLAGSYREYGAAVDKSFRWLSDMQYGEHNTYFASPMFRNRITGGLRHDYANSEAWIDGSAHFLLGISRLISQKHDPEIGD